MNKLILTAYQCYKIKDDDDESFTLINDDNNRSALNNIFNIFSIFLLDNLNTLNHFYLFKVIDAFYNSLFYNISLNINNSETIYTVSEKLMKESNEIYANNSNDNINKYIFIIWSMVKNVGKENRDILLNLLNKKDPSYKNSQSYLTNIQNNILKIINSNSKDNFNKNIIDSVILFNNTLISILKEKAFEYYDYFNQIISIILSQNQRNVQIYSLTLNLYTQIFTYNQNSEKYNIINKIGFDILNSINNIYNDIKNEEETFFLANKQTEFLLLYIQKSNYFLNNLNKEIFIQSINKIMSKFDESNQKDFSINFMNCIKLLFDLSVNNDNFLKILKDNFVEKLIKIIINHIQYFDTTYIKCIHNCFEIFKIIIDSSMKEQLYKALYDIYNDQELIEIIIKYIRFLKNINNMKQYIIVKKTKEFINDLSELNYAINKKRNEFIKKYENEMNYGIVNEESLRSVKIDPNSKIYMDLYAK